MCEPLLCKMKIRTPLLVAILFVVVAGCTSRSDNDLRHSGMSLDADSQVAGWLVQAQQAFEQGTLNAALNLTDSALYKSPDLPDLHFLRARIFTDMQRPDLAEDAYRQVLERDPEYEGAWLNLGNAAFRERAFDRALERYGRELAIHPTARVWVAIGSTYERMHQPDSARFAYEHAIALDGSYASAYMHFGQLYKSEGRLEEAVTASRKGLALEPTNLNYRFALGSLLVLTGDVEEAEQHLRGVVAAQPWNYWANHSLGRAYALMGRPDEAQYYFGQAERLQDSLLEITYWQNLARSNPDQFMLWVKLADALNRAGRESESGEAARMSLLLAPRYMVHSMTDSMLASEQRLAVGALLNGDVAQAIERYRRLLGRNEKHPDIWFNLGVALAASGRIEAAREAWNTALQHGPRHEGARTLLFQLDQRHTGDTSTQASR